MNAPPGYIRSPKGKLVPVPIILHPSYRSIRVARKQVRWLEELAEYWKEAHPGFASGNQELAEEIRENIQKLAF